MRPAKTCFEPGWTPTRSPSGTAPNTWGMHQPTVLRVELHDHGAKTRITLTDGPYPAGGERAEAGWNAALDKLAKAVTN